MSRLVSGDLIAAALAIAACRDETAAIAPTVRDSAGVVIVENARPRWRSGEAWRIADTPTVRIGTRDGAEPYRLFDVAGAVLLPDGRIAVADGGSQQIRFYTANGSFISAVGRRGEAPGEFGVLTAMACYRGDSLLIYDHGWHRFALFGPTGGYGRGWPLRQPADSTHYASPAAVADDGTLFMVSAVPVEPATTPHVSRPLVHVYRYSPDGEPGPLVATVQGPERYEAPGAASGLLSFGRTTVFAAANARLYVGNNDRYELLAYRDNGVIERIIRKQHSPRPVTDADIARERDRIAQGGSRYAQYPKRARAFFLEGLERRIAEMPFPSTFPAFSHILVDPGGRLWVLGYHPDDAEGAQGADVFEPDGAYLGWVEIPARLQVMDVGDEYMLGVSTDDLGVEFIHLHRIEKP